MKRVVVLGKGGGVLPGSYGVGSYEEHFNAHLEGKSGITQLEKGVSLTQTRTITHAGPVLAVPNTPYPRTVTRHSKKGIAMGLWAGYHALKSTGLPTTNQSAVNTAALGLDPYRFASWGASGYGDAEANNAFHELYLKNKWGIQIGTRAVQGTMPNGPSTTFAIVVGSKGKADTSTTACASSTDAFGNMFWLVKLGKADLGFVMGVDTLANEYYEVLFGLAHALSYKGVSIPFGKERDGFILAEGAVCAFLADLEFVKRNQLEAHVLAEVVGYGATCDAKDMTAPDTEAGARAVESAIVEAREDYGLDASAINFWSAHGTSTPSGDQNEADIIERVIKGGTIYVSSTKAHIGHMVGPAGLSGVLTAAHACFTDKIPTMGPYEIDPRCKKGGIEYITGSSVQTRVHSAISVAFGFGGQNAAVVLRKYEG